MGRYKIWVIFEETLKMEVENVNVPGSTSCYNFWVYENVNDRQLR
jgi:hypothetical protein